MAIILELQHREKTLPDKTYARRMKTNFQKTQKGTNLYILIANWLHKTYAPLYTQTSEMTTVYSISNTLNIFSQNEEI